MKSYSILRLQCNPSLNGFPQITACSSIKSVSHYKLPTVSVSQLVCVCVRERSLYGWRSVCFKHPRQISAETSSAEGLVEDSAHTHISLCIHTPKCTQEEGGISWMCINRVVRYVSAGFTAN